MSTTHLTQGTGWVAPSLAAVQQAVVPPVTVAQSPSVAAPVAAAAPAAPAAPAPVVAPSHEPPPPELRSPLADVEL